MVKLLAGVPVSLKRQLAWKSAAASAKSPVTAWVKSSVSASAMRSAMALAVTSLPDWFCSMWL